MLFLRSIYMSSDLNSMLSEYARQPLPRVTGPTDAEIWREIGRRRTQSLWSRISAALELPDFISEPHLAVAALTFAAIVGIVPAVMIGRAEKERRLARQSIHLEVFAVSANTIGSVLTSPKDAGGSLLR